MNTPHSSPGNPPVDLGAYRAWLFDLDGVLTRTATVHARAWKQVFDAFLADEARRTGGEFAPFDPVNDYEKYVDGEPRADGVRNFLTARGITLPEGADSDPATARTIRGVGNRKNAVLLELLQSEGIGVYDGTIELVRLLRATGIRTAVVSASENTVAALESAGIAGLFDARIDGVEVRKRHLAGKPAPDSYLAGAHALGVDAANAVVVEDALAGVEAGRAGHFGLVIGVDHHHFADRLFASGADVVVEDLSELLGANTTPAGSGPGPGLAKTQTEGNNMSMTYVANVASSVIFVRDLERSVHFYTEVLGCSTSLMDQGSGALLLAADGFQIYLIDKGEHEERATLGIGDHQLMWATDSPEGLEHFKELLQERDSYTYTHTAGGVTFIEGRDPDGGQVVMAYPSPQQRPRSVLDVRLSY